ncbi:hypothetical protein ACS15_3874 [Ralstonia insidiosa]|uniref:Uncharacterized protein n=1 Tax=Ralstonia insidiosa TaxID=190721 RepID=A0AAC9BE80_9RALS|nr:hypothetical protein ACS15_3874 [Ralstonia insidiosa]
MITTLSTEHHETTQRHGRIASGLLYNHHFLTRRFDDWLAGARES